MLLIWFGFFSVFAVLKIRSRAHSQGSYFLVQAVPLVPMSSLAELAFEKFLHVAANGKATESFSVIVSSTYFSITCFPFN